MGFVTQQDIYSVYVNLYSISIYKLMFILGISMKEIDILQNGVYH